MYLPPHHLEMDDVIDLLLFDSSQVALHKCSDKNFFWKYAANLQENTYTEV